MAELIGPAKHDTPAAKRHQERMARRITAHILKIREASTAYRGRKDLVRIGVRLGLELQRLTSDLARAAKMHSGASSAERYLQRGEATSLLASIRAKDDKLETVIAAMDTATRKRFWAVLDMRSRGGRR